jgi:hypothetical protein
VSSRLPRIATAALAIGLAAAHTVHAGPAAEPAGASDRADDASRLFEEGRLLDKDGDHAAACRKYEQSDALQRTFGTALNLGDCAASGNHLARAWLLYDEAARLAERDGAADREGAPNRARFARARAAALEPRLCTVIVTLADPAVAGLSVRVADRDLPPAARIRTLVDPGDIDVTVAAPHAPGLHQILHGAAGGVVTVDVPADATRVHEARIADRTLGFVALDRFDAVSHAGVETTYARPDYSSTHGTGPQPLRFEAHALYVDKSSGFGGYVQFPIFYTTGVSETTTFGDVEFGGVFAPRRQLGGMDLVLKAGITLPTGTAGGEANFGTTTNLSFTQSEFASLLVLRELRDSVADATTGVFGGAATVRRGKLFARVDLGLDWSFDARWPALHYDAGVGVDLGATTLMLESANLTAQRNGSADGTTPPAAITFNTLALSVRFDTASVSPYLAVTIPLEQDLSDFMTIGATLGVDVKLP